MHTTAWQPRATLGYGELESRRQHEVMSSLNYCRDLERLLLLGKVLIVRVGISAKGSWLRLELESVSRRFFGDLPRPECASYGECPGTV